MMHIAIYREPLPKKFSDCPHGVMYKLEYGTIAWKPARDTIYNIGIHPDTQKLFGFTDQCDDYLVEECLGPVPKVTMEK